ncbi:transporter [Micromonospora krabiensis]|uniref:ABC-2 family transporter protein n=1 Tax=Micromonospora krabiensis TaxID=307121 RepID=A0A1C3N2W8_9ACTN|nr:transporter [Micromonospora krabiensis]SBV26942.1 ABC-2 family transporter protein [Micromonospora krabiensis]
MIWMAWRQHRKQVLVTALGFLALAALMIPIGLSMRHTFDELGLAECARNLGGADVAAATADACEQGFHRFTDRYQGLNLVAVLLVVLPMLLGLFWGAPLVAREVEQGTHRFAWTQGISRRRWALVKFGLVGIVVLAASVLYGLGMSWWVEPLTTAAREGRLGFIVFDLQGVVPIAYTLFAVALGIFAGTVGRRMLPAMAITLFGYIGVRAAVALLARPHFQPARTLTFPVRGEGEPESIHGAWILANEVRNADGSTVLADGTVRCPSELPPGRECGAELGLQPGAYNWQLYQPADRFWPFQGIESGIFVALALILLYLSVRTIRRIA